MIEIIYRTNDQQDDTKVMKLPRNIRQIGQTGSTRKIYVEGSVADYLTTPPLQDTQVMFGVLLGENHISGGIVYTMIRGLVFAVPTDNMVDFNQKAWNGIYDDINNYFPELEIVGWYLSIPYQNRNDRDSLMRIHLDNFAGENKLCFFSDRKLHMEEFLEYGNGKMEALSGYYIYSEKNDEMVRYLKAMSGDSIQIIYPSPREPETNREGEVPIPQKKKKITARKLLSYSVAVISVAAIAMAVAAINRFGDIKALDSDLKKIMNYQSARQTEVHDRTEFETVNGSVNPIEEGSTGNLGEKEQGSSQKETGKDSEQKNNGESTQETGSQEEGRIQEEPLSPQAVYYTVQEGETLFEICMKVYHDSGMLQELGRANNLDKDYTIHQGQKLILP